MRYLGGKNRIAKPLVSFLESQREGLPYHEPFVGAAWVLAEMTGIRSASDACKPLIELYQALQRGWIPPETITEAEYRACKRGEGDPWLRAFIGFGCSFSGKWFAGYARSGTRNYASNARNSLLKKLPKLRDAVFYHTDYTTINLTNHLIYCDPPYETTTAYGAVPEFNHAVFWQTMREWSKTNKVFISSYQAPADFECVWSMPVKLDMHSHHTGKESRIEKLFQLNPS